MAVLNIIPTANISMADILEQANNDIAQKCAQVFWSFGIMDGLIVVTLQANLLI